MLRKVTFALLATLTALSCAAQTQTPRQALIEMFSGRDSKTFERHLPKIMQQRIAAISSGSHSGFPTTPQSLPSAFGHKGDLRWFDTGPILLLMQDANSRLEVRVEKDNLQGDRDDIDLSLNATASGQSPTFGNGTRVLLTMQKEDGIWRLSEFGLTFKMKLDGSFIEAISRQMNMASKPAVITSTSEAIPARKMSAQELSPTEKVALNSVRQLLAAQTQHKTANPTDGFSCDPESLGVMEVSGYRTMIVGCKGTPVSNFKITLTPIGMGAKGLRAFCADESGLVRYADDGRGVSCLSEHNQIE